MFFEPESALFKAWSLSTASRDKKRSATASSRRMLSSQF